MEHSVTIQVPGTTANLGPGFDCLGVAVGIANRVHVERASIATAPHFPIGAEAAALFFGTCGMDPFPFHCAIDGDVPRSRGLGSSVTVRLGVLHGLNLLCGRPQSRETIANLCTRLEGHPDNAFPAEFGGFVAANMEQQLRFEVDPRLWFVFAIPETPIETDASRDMLPANIDRRLAVRNVANASVITAAFASRRYDCLRHAFDDYLHQPFRGRFQPHLVPGIAAGTAAGALGGYLSGSGSAVACLTLEDPWDVGEAMRAAVEPLAGPSRVMTVQADNEGTKVVEVVAHA